MNMSRVKLAPYQRPSAKDALTCALDETATENHEAQVEAAELERREEELNERFERSYRPPDDFDFHVPREDEQPVILDLDGSPYYPEPFYYPPEWD
jgi:hypothetical protein